MKIGWIGAGVMGQSMYAHLAKEHKVSVYTRTPSKIKEKKQIQVCNDIATCIQDCDVIFTMVAFPYDVEEVYFSKHGILEYAKKGAYLIDMTTSSPQLAKRIAAYAHSFHVLDAPVSGGDSGARNATLSIMVGGEEKSYEAMLPILSLLGTNITYMGEAGMGQHCKMCNQIAVAGASAAYSEALVYAQANDLDPQLMLQAIASGAAGSWQINNMAPRVLQSDFDPGFFIKHFIKDMQIAQQEMTDKNTSLQMLNTVLEMYKKLAEQGYEHLGTQALIQYYKK